MNNQPVVIANKNNTVLLVYILYVLSFFLGGITALVGALIALANKENSTDFEKSHFRFQFRLFMWGLLWFSIGFITSYILIGFAILAVWFVWTVYQLIVGWSAYSRGEMAP